MGPGEDEPTGDGPPADDAPTDEPAPVREPTPADDDADLTDGSLLKPLLVLSAPIVVTQLFQVLYNLVDTFWVGQLGQEAVTALSFSWPPVFVLISLGGGITLAGSVLVAQNKGADRFDRVNEVAGQTLAFVTLFALGLGVVGWFATPWFADVIGATPGTTVFAYTVEYMRVIFVGVWFMFGFFVFQALLRGWGDTRTPMYLMAASVTVNIVIDPIFIFGFVDNPLFEIVAMPGLESWLYDATGFVGFGVEGAAIATILSRALATIPGIALLFSGYVGISLSPADLKLDRRTVRKIVEVGYPASIEQSSGALSYTAMTAIVALVGQTSVAAFGISSRINSFVFLLAIGVGMGVETAVGQNLGANQVRRAKRVVFMATGILVATYFVFTMIAVTYAESIVSVFIQGEGAAEVVDIGMRYLYIIAPTWAAMGVFHLIKGCFNGAGSTRAAMIFSVFSVWGLQIVPGYVLVETLGWGTDGAWWAIAFMHVGAALIVTAWFATGDWTDNVVDEEEQGEGGQGGEEPVATPTG